LELAPPSITKEVSQKELMSKMNKKNIWFATCRTEGHNCQTQIVHLKKVNGDKQK